jgi:hypothetical protein
MNAPTEPFKDFLAKSIAVARGLGGVIRCAVALDPK